MNIDDFLKQQTYQEGLREKMLKQIAVPDTVQYAMPAPTTVNAPTNTGNEEQAAQSLANVRSHLAQMPVYSQHGAPAPAMSIGEAQAASTHGLPDSNAAARNMGTAMEAANASRSGSGGILKGILGNLASSYLSNKFKNYQQTKDAELNGQVLSDQISVHKELYPKDSSSRHLLDTLQSLSNKKTPGAVAIATKGYEHFFNALAKNEEQTALTKDAALSGVDKNNPTDALLLRRKFAGTHLPTGYEYDENGNINSIKTPEGKDINDIMTGRSITTKQTPGFGAEENLRRLQDQADFNRSVQSESLDLRRQSLELSRENAKNNIDKLEAMPAAHRMAWVTNNATVAQAERAKKLVEDHPEYFNITTRAGETWNQYISPKGVAARAEVAAIGGTQFHSLAGATGTTGEQKLYYPFIPNIEKDNADTIAKKLDGFTQRTKAFNNELENAYSEGFKHTPWKNQTNVNKDSGLTSPEEEPTDAQLKAAGISKVGPLRLSPKAMTMPKEKQDIVMDVLKNGSEKDKLKLLQKGWLGE
jgi:hypothetical protein